MTVWQYFEPWRLEEAQRLPDAPSGVTWLWQRVKRPAPAIATHVVDGGLQLVDPQETDAALFAGAASALATSPNLASVVSDRVRAIHMLRAQPGYDVSHSEPVWARRIFVSLPDRCDRVGELRLAESIIHEAMHLHLTLYETACPLVRDLDGQTFSPWRQAQRPYQGVLHGLYVFTCLAAFFCGHAKPDGFAAADHVQKRVDEIADEIATIDQADLEVGLTPAGRQLLTSLTASIDDAWKSSRASA